MNCSNGHRTIDKTEMEQYCKESEKHNDDHDYDTLRCLWNDDDDDDDDDDPQPILNHTDESIWTTYRNPDNSNGSFAEANTSTTANTTTRHSDSRLPPSYLIQAILAGLYELPPPHILQYQTGWGRRIRYHHVQHIPTHFQNLENVTATEQTGPPLYNIQYMALPRYSDFQVLDSTTTESTATTTHHHHTNDIPSPIRKRATQCHEFNIYRVQLLRNDDDSTATATANPRQSMNDQLRQWAYREIQHNTIGLNVSNAGGTYHGLPNFFRNIHPDNDAPDSTEHPHKVPTGNGKQELYHHIRNIMEQIEQYEVSIQQQHSTTTNISSTLPWSLALESQDIECWVNISQTNGSWNRLHTHEGSAYSGVYYVSSSSNATTNNNDWNGNFIFKPTPHPLEDTYILSYIEQCRLRRRGSDNSDCPSSLPPLPYIDEVQYVMIPPTPGTMIVFPSYVHHCVLPLQVEPTMHDGNAAVTVNGTSHHQDNRNNDRISIAFNINWKKELTKEEEC
jgi:hypothetical protein